jgi:hypothetical protein
MIVIDWCAQTTQNIAAGQPTIESVVEDWVYGKDECEVYQPDSPIYSHYTRKRNNLQFFPEKYLADVMAFNLTQRSFGKVRPNLDVRLVTVIISQELRWKMRLSGSANIIRTSLCPEKF